MKNFKDTDIEILIGRTLRAGTMLSISVVLFGGVIYLHRHGHTVADYSVFKHLPDFLMHTGTLIHNAIEMRGQAIIQIGIVLLIATPILRVMFSAFGFLLEKDYLYFAISLLVLLIIFLSMLTGRAG
jgi:uncharacterized membrane protein